MARKHEHSERERARQRGVKRRARARARAENLDAYLATQREKMRLYRAERKRIKAERLKNKPINLTGLFDDL